MRMKNHASRTIGSASVSGRKPIATARIGGSDLAPDIGGVVNFYAAPSGGTLVAAELYGLPDISLPTAERPMQIGPFGFHVHEGSACGSPAEPSPFAEAGGHYNPTVQPHPLHAGDLPVIFPNRGRGVMQAYTDRFRPQDVIGRTVVLHQMPDDFRSQPSGDSGLRIGCGEIVGY